jgi:NADPH:quinone reductase-like Zn-dependent oxidoreductase
MVERKPANLSFEQAAAMPLAGYTALKGLRDAGKVRNGQRVLINGASGGVGTFAIQIGKTLGAEVTAVCSTRNIELVRSLGADHVIDYTRADFTCDGQHYDVVFDLVGNHPLGELRHTLATDGTLILSGGGTHSSDGSFFGPMALFLRAQLVSKFARKQTITLLTTPPDSSYLADLRELAEAGQITPVIDRTYPLSAVPEAIRYVAEEHARSKVVITIS